MRLLILSKPNMLLHNRVGQFLSLPAGTSPEHHPAYGYNAIGFDEAANCWVQDVSAWFDLHSIIFFIPAACRTFNGRKLGCASVSAVAERWNSLHWPLSTILHAASPAAGQNC